MAGGIDWFRWHHGSVNDQKFPLIARRAGASVAEVIAVWANLLERASQNDDRGSLGSIPDFEAMDCAMGMEDGRCARIFAAMQDRGLVIDGLTLEAWARRQPKKEDEGAAERKRQQREREAAAKAEREAAERAKAERDTKQGHDASRDVTLEESREEKNSSSLRSEEATRKRAPARPDEVSETVWSDWLQLRKAKKAPVTGTVVENAQAEARKAGMTLDAFLRVWCARGSQGLQADWLKPHERAGPAATRMDRQLETAAHLTGARRPQQKHLEAIDVESRIVPILPA